MGCTALVLLTLAGCSTRLDFDPTPTGSIAAPAEPAVASATVSPVAAAAPEHSDDWETVRRHVVAATPQSKAADPAPAKPAKPKLAAKPTPSAKPQPQAIAWQNADSGNSGTITDLIASTSAGRPCRHFAATRASYDGVRAYRGEVCKKGGAWEYTKLEPLDRGAEAGPKS